MPSEAQKKASAKWTKENMGTIACKLKKEQVEQFKEYCDGFGKTPNAVLKEYILSCLNSMQKDTPNH